VVFYDSAPTVSLRRSDAIGCMRNHRIFPQERPKGLTSILPIWHAAVSPRTSRRKRNHHCESRWSSVPIRPREVPRLRYIHFGLWASVHRKRRKASRQHTSIQHSRILFPARNSMSTMVLNPIAAFFLVPALALGKNGKPPRSITTEDLVEYAQPQFSAWFSLFKTRISQRPTARVILRLFVGESLAFAWPCTFARNRGRLRLGFMRTHLAVYRLCLTQMTAAHSAAAPAPLQFNLIETSNLADQCWPS
jgi:hypothetical protein